MRRRRIAHVRCGPARGFSPLTSAEAHESPPARGNRFWSWALTALIAAGLAACGTASVPPAQVSPSVAISPASTPAITQAIGGSARAGNSLTVIGLDPTNTNSVVSSVTCFKDAQGRTTSAAIAGLLPQAVLFLTVLPARLELRVSPVPSPGAPSLTPGFDPRPDFAASRTTDVTSARIQFEADLTKTDKPGGAPGPVHVKVDAACP